MFIFGTKINMYKTNKNEYCFKHQPKFTVLILIFSGFFLMLSVMVYVE